MKKLFSTSHIRSLLAWSIKLGTMGFNLPATLGVASSIAIILLHTTDPLLILLLQVSGVIVVDTVFLASWYELDSNKTQDDSDKLADAITVVIMYGITIAIGVLHGEGWAGFLFRVPMGIAVARSTWKTLSYSIRRTGEDTKGKNIPLAVRWEQMKAVSAKGIAVIRSEVLNFIADLKARDEVRATHRTTQTRVGNEVVLEMEPIYREQAVASAKSSNVTMAALPSLITTPSNTVSATNSNETKSGGTASIKKNYSIHNEGSEWVATCLHPGCSVVVRNGSSDTVRRKIVGHGNKHKNSIVTVSSKEVVVEGEVADQPNTDPQGF